MKDISLKRIFLFVLKAATSVAAFSQNYSSGKNNGEYANEAVKTLEEFRKTSPFLLNEKRLSLLKTFETYYPHGQASITKTLEHLPGVECDNTIIPFWGEKMTWEKGKLE